MSVQWCVVFSWLCAVSVVAQQYIVQLQPQRGMEQPHVRMYYKGHRLQHTDSSVYRLPEACSISAFSVVIADDIDFETDYSGTVTSIKRPAGRNCRWFDVTYNPRNQYGDWDVSERPCAETPERTIEHTLYVLTDPHVVEALRVYQIGDTVYIQVQCGKDADNAGNDNEIHALMASLDAQAFHTDVPRRELCEGYVTISILCNMP